MGTNIFWIDMISGGAEEDMDEIEATNKEPIPDEITKQTESNDAMKEPTMTQKEVAELVEIQDDHIIGAKEDTGELNKTSIELDRDKSTNSIVPNPEVTEHAMPEKDVAGQDKEACVPIIVVETCQDENSSDTKNNSNEYSTDYSSIQCESSLEINEENHKHNNSPKQMQELTLPHHSAGTLPLYTARYSPLLQRRNNNECVEEKSQELKTIEKILGINNHPKIEQSDSFDDSLHLSSIEEKPSIDESSQSVEVTQKYNRGCKTENKSSNNKDCTARKSNFGSFSDSCCKIL